MCSISENIVLCTCKVENAQDLKHFWVLYRIHDGEKLMLVGEPIGFDDHLQEKDPHNPVILCNKLNEGNLFDAPINFVEKDRLHISFLFKGNTENVNYGFEFKNGKWRVIDFEYFDWAYEHQEIREGKIKNAIKRIKQ